MVALDIIISV